MFIKPYLHHVMGWRVKNRPHTVEPNVAYISEKVSDIKRNQEETKLWHEFPEELVQKMSEIPFALHAHTYTVTLETF